MDIEELRRELMDYFGTAMTSGFPMATVDLVKIERASKEELISIAKKNGFDVSEYLDLDEER